MLEYHSIVETILNWSDQVFAWHHNGRSTGPLKGINNLIQPSAEPSTDAQTPTTTPPEEC